MKLNPVEKEEFSRYSKYFDSLLNEMKDRSFLITGSKGLVGEGLIKTLLFLNETKDLNVTIYASTRNPNDIPHYLEGNDPVFFVPFSKEDSISKPVIDYIIHGAAPTSRSFLMEHPVETMNVIVNETEKMLTLAQQRKTKSLLYISSVEYYGIPKNDLPIKETSYGLIDPHLIRSGYPLGKHTSEFLCTAYFSEYGVPVKIVRPSSIQGLFQSADDTRFYNQVLNCILKHENLILESNGSTKRSVIYTLDAILAFFYVLFNGANGEAYNVANSQNYFSIKETAERLFAIFSPHSKVLFNKKTQKQTGYLPKLNYNQSVLKLKKIGWKPHTNLQRIYANDIKRICGQAGFPQGHQARNQTHDLKKKTQDYQIDKTGLTQ